MISLRDLSIQQGKFSLTEICLKVETGQYAILTGATGAGKTTLLEAICGLRLSQTGQVIVDDRDVTRLDPGQRNLGYVPQDSVLFPTMRVDRQIEFAMEIRRQSKTTRQHRVAELADLLDLTNVLKRFPDGLSGGERQRVALARALAFSPSVLCLDEPLSALDAATKEKITGLLRLVHQEENVTVLHITHNIDEAKQLGTVFFELRNGCVHQITK